MAAQIRSTTLTVSMSRTGEGASNAWSTSDFMGAKDTDGTHNFYLEDCFFTGFHQGSVDFHNSVRGVIRHCVLDNSAITTHGPDTAAEGARHTEVYDCVGIFDTATSPKHLARQHQLLDRLAWRLRRFHR